MRIVVTGASGNVGTALLRRLGGEGHDITALSRRPPPPDPPYDAASWVPVDLTSAGVHELTSLFAGAAAVVHLAWGFQPSHNVEHLHRLDVEGTRTVVRAAQAAGVAHLVHQSSVGAYSPGNGPVDESWPTDGIGSLAYSRHKVAAERILDEHERMHPDGPAVARMRPALIVQRESGSELLRYGLPPYVPAAVLRHVPVLPLDRSLVVPLVHADDVADAIARVLERRATGPFNLAADPPVTRDVIAAALGARPLHVPRQVLRAVVDVTWRLRLQPLDPGWLDLAFAVPLLDSGRARRELGWAPRIPADAALAEVLAGMADRAATTSPVLRRRSVAAELVATVRGHPIDRRPFP
jgi:nucleoside-diphosphate-sugar epimerase